MAQKLEDLILRIEADSAELRRGLADAERQVSGSAGRMRSSFEGVGPVLARLGALAAGAGIGLGALAKRSLDSADELGKASDRIGIATEELQKLRFAADLAGVSSASLDKALEQFVKRLGEAPTGRGSLVQTLKDLDPALLAALGSAESTGEAFLVVADAIAATEDPARRAAIGNAAFGRSWAGLVNLLATGREGIAAAGADLEKFGAVYSREAAAGAEAVNDALTELATFASTRFTAALIGANGEVRSLAEILRDPKLRSAVGDFSEDLATIANVLFRVTAAGAGAISRLRELVELRDRVGTALNERWLRFLGPDAPETGIRVLPDFRAQANALGFDEFGNPLPLPPRRPAPPALAGFETPPAASTARRQASSGADPLRAALDRLREEEELRRNALEELRSLERDTTREALELAEDRAGVIRLETEARIEQLEELARVLPGREAEIAAAREAIVANSEERIRQELEQTRAEGAQVFEDLADLAGRTLGDFFANTLTGEAEASFSEIAKSFAANLIRMEVEAAASGIFEALSKSGSSSSGGAGGSFLGGLLGGLANVFAFAEGGIATRPTVGVLAEAGEAEAVLPLSRLRGLLGEVGAPVVNVINQSGVPLEVGQVQQQRRGNRWELDVAVEAAWTRSASRGAFRDALGRRHQPGVG